jgi:hypothetical protein
MPTEDQVNKPDYKNAAFKRMAAALQVVRDVAGGTARMRECGETYLPREPGEKDQEYKARLARSVFFNAYRKTREALVGMVFRENPKIGEDVSEIVKQQLENVDLAGTHLDVFAKELFTDAFEGHSFILVDMDAALPTGSTLADEKAAGRRPYWVKYKKDQALNWTGDRINGETVLTQITFEECSTEPSGRFGEDEVTKYRVFWLPIIDDGKNADGNQVRPASYGLVQWELWKKIQVNGKDDVILENAGTTSLTRIPVSVVYGRKIRFLESEPPLLDLAYLNIDHWQQYSDYRTQLNRLVPILVRVGVPVEQQTDLKTGPGCLVDMPKDCELTYVSHDGEALDATHTGIVDAEQRMAMAGLSILTQRADSNITATEKKMDQSERTSELSTMARSLKDCLERSLGFHAQYLNLADKNGDGGSIELGVADDLTLDPQDLAIARDMVREGSLTVETLHLLAGKRWRTDLSGEIEEIKKRKLFVGQPTPGDVNKMKTGADKILQGGLQ